MTMRDSSSSMACTDCMACSLSGVARLRRSATLAALSCVFLLLCGVPGEGKKDLTKTLRGPGLERECQDALGDGYEPHINYDFSLVSGE